VRSSRRAFAAAMDKLHAAYPDDESATFLAVALIATIHPGDPDEAAVRERAAALAGEVFARNPKHPGAAHYLIHACDTAELAERALPAARTYADIAPEAFHARHMPAHIFSRLGMWKEAITSCQAAWDASVAAAARHRLGPEHHDFHSLSWLVEMNFELGKRRAADAAMKQFGDEVRAGLSHQNRTAYVQQVVSYLGRSGEWKRVEELLAPLEAPAGGEAGGSGPAPASRPAESPPGAASCSEHAPAGASSMMELFERRSVAMARARAAAGLRDVASARRRLDEVAAIDVELHEILIHSQPPELLARQEQTNERSRRPLLARARGDDRALLAVIREMRAAGWDPGGEVPLSAFLDAEGEADALLALGRAGEALTIYQEVLRENPGRARSMLGAARAARRAGQPAEASAMYEKLLAQWADAEEGTEGLAEARAAVSRPSRTGQ